MNSSLLSTAIGKFRLIAFLEGCSYIMLGFTMLLKYKYDMPLPNYIVGMAHGGLFLFYIGLLLYVSWVYKWNLWHVFLAFIASLIPFGTFYADFKWFRKIKND